MPDTKTIIRRLLGIERIHMEALSIEGRTVVGNHPLRILYVHEPCAFLRYIENLAFRSKPKERFVGTIKSWQADKLAKRGGYDLVLVYGWNAPLVNTVFRDYYFLPQWVSAEVELEPDAIHEGNSPSRRRDIRKIEANGLTYCVTTDTADLEHFYNEMYFPTINAAHGNAAILMSCQSMLDRVQAGKAELVYIFDGQRAIAGSLIVYDDGEPRLLSLGVLHADREYYRAGVGSAIYLFSFRHLLDHGFKRVDIGRTRPFLNDGTLYFKRRLGMKVTGGTEHGFLMKPLNNDAGVREFLCSSPFVYANGNKLRGIAFFDSDSRAQDAANLGLPGLSRFETLDIRRDEFTGRLTPHGPV